MYPIIVRNENNCQREMFLCEPVMQQRLQMRMVTPVHFSSAHALCALQAHVSQCALAGLISS